MNLKTFINKLENQLFIGRGKWVAEFNESFVNYPLDNFVFPLFIRGQTRSKGFLLSRIFAYFAMPNYLVSCFVHSPNIKREDLKRSIKTISKMMKKNNIRWSWLVIPKESEFDPKIKEFVENNDSSNVGIALINLISKHIITNKSLIGKKIKTILKF